MTDFQALAQQQFCYLTTFGRVSGRSHEIEIWFALDGSTLYMLAGNHRSDWVLNLDRNPEVTVRIDGRIMQGRGRRVEAGREEERARVLVGTKYGEWRPGRTRTGWTWEALPVAVDLENQGTKEPENQGSKEPENQGTKEPENQGTKEPENQGTKEPENQRTST